jgi:hypothetical protein
VLRSFRVANHKSIRAAQELVLLPAYDKSRPVTPVAAIYGANASGKSNLLDALTWMRRAVLDSFASWTPGGGVPRVPFKLDRAAAKEPTEFAVDLILDGVRHYYGFVVDDDMVREEWLHTFPKGRRRIIFERDGDDWTFGSTVRRSMDSTRELTRPNALFLSVAARSEVVDALPVFSWFESIVGYQRGTDLRPGLTRRLREGGHARTELVELIRTADVGISDVVMNDIADLEAAQRLLDTLPGHVLGAHAASDSGNDMVFRLADGRFALVQIKATMVDPRFRQGQHGITLRLDEQSDGTLAWIEVVLSALDVLADGRVLLADELDLSLHPRLAARLVELFGDPRTNPRHAQLIFTTHDAALLGTSLGVPVLNRDEVWFVEKAADGATSLFPLTDFHPRKEENTERRYLGGSYGAVPAIYSDSLVERLVAVREEPGRAAS